MEKHAIVYVVVNYFNDEEVIRFLSEEIRSQIIPGVWVLVVNNGSYQVENLKSEVVKMDFVEFMDAGTNRGYLGAAWYGLEILVEKWGEWPGMVILSNTDMKIRTQNLLNELMLQLSPLNFGMAGPSIHSFRYKKQNQNPFFERRITNNRLRILITVFSSYPGYIIYQLLAILKASFFTRNQQVAMEVRSVYSVHGSFMIFNTSFLKQIENEIKEAPFLFGEEIYLAELARKYNRSVLFLPQFAVDHMEHATTGIFKSPRLVKQMLNALQIIRTKFFNSN